MELTFKRLDNATELRDLRAKLKKEHQEKDTHRVRVCCGTACQATGSKKLIKQFEEEAKKKQVPLEIVKTGCQGFCQRGPVVIQDPQEIFYQKVKVPDVSGIFSESVLRGMPYRKQLYREDSLADPNVAVGDIPFYKKQKRLALHRNGVVDPCNIYDAVRDGGYEGLAKVLTEMKPDEVIDIVKRSGLRGRGGAGFPAGLKWEHTKKSGAKIKAVVCNGDEGDPGAFMDRSLMEGDPHSVLEGMVINAYAIGAQHGYLYVRHEYPLAVKNLGIAIEQARALGLLGKNILGSGLDFDCEIKEGAGAFVCGESTALVASIEGQRGMPRPRPPRLSEAAGGLWGMPTNLNNVETFANVPTIFTKGLDYYTSIGTEKSKGTKVFALTGKIKNTGLIEVPMGITLREIIFDIGGGMLNPDKEFKAVQTGGPSGGCIPAQFLDLKVDFDTLATVGSIMGSGGMVVMDEDDCMVDVAKYFLSFTKSESCGKCPPCRIGTWQMYELLDKITSGGGEEGDIERLEKMGRLVVAGSLCGLGNSAPNPVLSTIKYFREEYEEHVRDKFCRAKRCQGLGMFRIRPEHCILCGLCKTACAFDAVVELRDRFYIDQDYCTKCKACYGVCPTQAIVVEKGGAHVKAGK
ncbi:MAG TPA: NADH-quinone oxidoreductase subunit NuoF [Nitrospirota bacterium]|nr:NADH-quinone oxidoreductase subunit NuoF [Nitrospirota bacterium]